MTSFEEVMAVTRNISAADALQDTECKALYDSLLHVPTGGIVVEIGCQLGRSSSIIAQLQPVVKYHSIHIDPYTEQPEYLKGWIAMMERLGDVREHEWTLLCMRTEQAEWLLKLIGNNIDLAFVDGDHEYPSVMTDLALVGNRIKQGGYLLAHDYRNPGLPGVNQALSQYTNGSWGNWHEVGVYEGLGVWCKL